jgi:hypothetical protein
MGRFSHAPGNGAYGSAESNAGQTGGHDRRLVYIPIIHTVADMGTLGALHTRNETVGAWEAGFGAQCGRGGENVGADRERGRQPAGYPGTVRVYQDGLPVCGHEQDIVSELAGAGSRNHRLLLKLQARGATLMGTESPELLVQEYQLATAGFASGVTVRTEVRQKQLRDTLLEKRDRYIADRINGTLGAGESGILFMGMLHAVAKYLDADINVVYPLGPPRVEQRKGV